ncbi:MAG TPA: exosortase H-associated membrane protein [Casimicrobiaceae bacterium]|nr:exosortase H-associated membrane protein [Casimicrobiaceae bacterium]
MTSPVFRFVVLVLAWLPLAFAVWYVLAPVILFPAELIVRGFADVALRGLVDTIDSHGAVLSFVTSLRPGEARSAGIVTVDVNVLLYAFGLPLFVALVLAAREKPLWRPLLVGYAVMMPFIAWGVLADFLKNVAITAPPLVASQAGFGPRARDMIAFAYQLGSLILPAVVPAVVWVLTHRAFLTRMRATGAAAATRGQH